MKKMIKDIFEKQRIFFENKGYIYFLKGLWKSSGFFHMNLNLTRRIIVADKRPSFLNTGR